MSEITILANFECVNDSSIRHFLVYQGEITQIICPHLNKDFTCKRTAIPAYFNVPGRKPSMCVLKNEV